MPEEKLRVVYLSVHPECSAEPSPEHDAAAARLLGPIDRDGPPEILHVGSNIPRKRIDVLLNVFAGILRAVPGARLVKVGGEFTPAQRSLAESLGVSGAITVIPYFDPKVSSERATLAAVYRRAALALQTSDAEGFGLPVAEAMACGTVVLASDLPVLREVGGDAAVYRPVGASPDWVEAAMPILEGWRDHRSDWQARRAAGIARAVRFAWTTHVDLLMQMYRDVLSGRPVSRPPGV
jgi:glycosyltransferase involved in cell wall biosynthesis